MEQRPVYMSAEDWEAPDPIAAYPIWLEWPWRIWCALIWLAQRALPSSADGSKVQLEMCEGILDCVIAGNAAFSVYEDMGLPIAALASLKWDYPEVMPRRAHIRVTPVILRLVDGQDIHFCDYQINSVPVPGNLAYFEALSTGDRIRAVGWNDQGIFSAWGVRIGTGQDALSLYASRRPQPVAMPWRTLLAGRNNVFPHLVQIAGFSLAGLLAGLGIMLVGGEIDTIEAIWVCAMITAGFALTAITGLLIIAGIRVMAGPLLPIPAMMARGLFGVLRNQRFTSYDFGRHGMQVRRMLE
ncbi:conserved membrane hypothetical protein [Cupriavidus taiwanensis]|nr:conserved membrane hypothetical protein [Cupriavidus taiwanensis]